MSINNDPKQPLQKKNLNSLKYVNRYPLILFHFFPLTLNTKSDNSFGWPQANRKPDPCVYRTFCFGGMKVWS